MLGQTRNSRYLVTDEGIPRQTLSRWTRRRAREAGGAQLAERQQNGIDSTDVDEHNAGDAVHRVPCHSSLHFGKNAVLQMEMPTMGMDAFEKQQLVNCNGKDSGRKRTASPPGKQPSPKKQNAASSPSLRRLKPHDPSTDETIEIAKTSNNIVTIDPQKTRPTSQTDSDSTSNSDDSSQSNTTILNEDETTEVPSSENSKKIILEGDTFQGIKSYSLNSAYKSCSAVSGNEQQPSTSNPKDEEKDRLRAQVKFFDKLIATDDVIAAGTLVLHRLTQLKSEIRDIHGRLDIVDSKCQNLCEHSVEDSVEKRTASPPGKQPSPKKQNAESSSPSLRPLKPHDLSTDKTIEMPKTSNNIVTIDPQVTLPTSQTASDSTSSRDDSSQSNTTILNEDYSTEVPSSENCKKIMLEDDNFQGIKSYSLNSADKSCSAVSGNEEQLSTINSKDEVKDLLRTLVDRQIKLLTLDERKAVFVPHIIQCDEWEVELSICRARLEVVESKLRHEHSKVTEWLDKCDFTSSIE